MMAVQPTCDKFDSDADTHLQSGILTCHTNYISVVLRVDIQPEIRDIKVHSRPLQDGARSSVRSAVFTSVGRGSLFILGAWQQLSKCDVTSSLPSWGAAHQ